MLSHLELFHLGLVSPLSKWLLIFKLSPTIEERLQQICDWPQDTLLELIVKRWESSSKITACPAQWNLFVSHGHFISLIKCFTGLTISNL